MVFKNLPIRQKLMLVNLFTSGAVLSLTCLSFIAYEVITLRKGMVQGYNTRAQIIAANSSAALAFQNETDATEVLGALKTDPRTVVACIYDEEGGVFAKYPANAPIGDFAAGPRESGYRGGYLETYCPILQGDRTLGTVFIRSNLSALTGRYIDYGYLSAAIIAGSLLIGFLLSRMLQKQISVPVLALAETARAISVHRDFSVRARKFGEDELGLLTDAFNKMLGEISAQDQALKASEVNYREIFDKANDAIYIHEAETGRVLDVNTRTCDLFGFTRDEFLKGDPNMFMTGNPGYTFDIALSHLKRAAAGEPQLFEWQGKNKDGSFRWLEVSIKQASIAGQKRLLALVRDIGDRKKAQEALEEKTRLLDSIMSNMSEGVAVAGLDGKMLYFNKGLEEMTGMKKSTQAPSEWSKEYGIFKEDKVTPFPPEESPMVKAVRGEDINGVVQFLRNAANPDGIFVSVNGKPLRGEKGKVVGGMVVVRNITRELRDAEALQVSEKNYREIFDKASDGIVILDPDPAAPSPVVDINSRIAEMAGYSVEEFKRSPIEKLLSGEPGSTPEDFLRWNKKALTEGPQLFEWGNRHKKGHPYWVEVNLQKAVLAGKTRLVAFVRDISERKKLEEVMKAQSFVSSVLENVPNMIFVKDAKDLRFVMFNKAGEELLGIPKSDLIGKNDYDFFPKQEADFFTEKDRKTLEGKKLLDIPEETIQTKDKGPRILHTKKIPVLGKDGAPQYLMGISEDITEQKQQESLKIYTKSLETSNKELQDFIFVASHDLQEPLRKIQAFGNFLKEEVGGSLNQTASDYLSRIQGAANRMGILIEDLLQLTRITTRAKPFEQTDLSKVLEEIKADLEMRLKDTGGRVEVSALPKLEADPAQMRQLFQNLVGNALKFHRPGVAPLVDVTGKKEGGMYRILVKDNGIGFEQKYADKIFNIFQRLHGQGEYEGTGIGLAICRKVVERHQGKINATSKPGEGAVFEILLPLSQNQPGGNG